MDENFYSRNMLTVAVKTNKKIRNQVVAVVQALNKKGEFAKTKKNVRISTSGVIKDVFNTS